MDTKNKMGSVRGRSSAGFDSMRDRILEEPQEVSREATAAPEDKRYPQLPYAEGLDNILTQIFEKEKSLHEVIRACAQIFEARGIDIPVEDARFRRTCEKIAEIQAAREVAHLFGLGPDLSDRIANNLIDHYFGGTPTVRRKK